jgi:hypothetical protein
MKYARKAQEKPAGKKDGIKVNKRMFRAGKPKRE